MILGKLLNQGVLCFLSRDEHLTQAWAQEQLEFSAWKETLEQAQGVSLLIVFSTIMIMILLIMLIIMMIIVILSSIVILVSVCVFVPYPFWLSSALHFICFLSFIGCPYICNPGA